MACMRRLLVLRHAKSSWADPDLADFDRPLVGRGKRASNAIAEFIVSNGYQPDRVLCSPAKRARQTYSRASRIIGEEAVLSDDESLYLASEREICSLVRSVDLKYVCAMVVGHNPGLHDFARSIAGAGHPDLLSSLGQHMPTAALAVFELDNLAWSDVGPGALRLSAYVKPRDLTGG